MIEKINFYIIRQVGAEFVMFKISRKNKEPFKKMIDGIGEVSFKFSNRAKRLSITIKPDASVHVTIPYKLKPEIAESFVYSKKEWIRHKLIQIKAEEIPEIQILGIRESTTIIKSRIRQLAETNNFNFNRVSIKKMRTRWGSCSPSNNINLNYLLASLPDYLMDYVILHELVHTVVKNHKSEFWEKLDLCLKGKNSKTLQKELKQYGKYLYRSAL